MMNKVGRILITSALGVLFAGVAFGDTLELKDGRVLQGKFLGGTQALVRFEVGQDVRTFKVNEVVALTFTGTGNADSPSSYAPSETRPEAVPARSVTNTPRAAHERDNGAPNTVTIPAGQTLLVRMIDGVDSKKNNVGDTFHASLETDLRVDDTLVARKGTDVYGRLATAHEAGHMSGSSELQLELTRIIIDGREYFLTSSDYTLKGKGRGGDTAKKVGVGAIGGAIIGAIAGGGTGAAIGAGVGSAAGAGVQVFTRGQEVRVPSETVLEFRMQNPVTVSPTRR
ncbi:MAG TPA: hypothetical protein VOA64_08580 [Candidatus Dormibacteraeota bacterium]|nr:hypothetical protein [Candidatus Dormibacteraeota bacterium]